MSLKAASFFATYTTGILNLPSSKVQEEIHKITLSKQISSSTEQIGIYSWNFTYIDDAFAAITEEISTSSGIVKMQLSFRYNNNIDGVKILARKYGGTNPELEDAATILLNSTTDNLSEILITQTNQTSVTITLNDIGNFYYDSFLKIVDRLQISIIMIRDPNLTSNGSVDISGQTLVGGTSEWRPATSMEPIDAPLLIVTYDIPSSVHPKLNMRFTGSDPTLNQTTSANSIGSYVSLNSVYTSGLIRESINSTQTTIPIDIATPLPTNVGLASVGPEIFRFTNIDKDNIQLTGITRGIAPLSSFPAGFNSLNVPERVYYLDNLTQLFDTRPSSGLVQYRCVGIVNDDGDNDLNIQSANIGIIQDSKANVQIRIGVEVPKFDAVKGITGSGTTTTVIKGTGLLKADGFYDGAGVKFLSPIEYAIIDTYTSDGEFTIDRTINGLTSGRNFVILPAPSQAIPNDATAPTTNNGLFSGFSEDASGITIILQDHGTIMQELDLFYVWIRRTLIKNTEETNNTGSVLIFRFEDA